MACPLGDGKTDKRFAESLTAAEKKACRFGRLFVYMMLIYFTKSMF